MCKKAIFTTVAVALGLFVLSYTKFGYKMCGLAELAWNKAGTSVTKSVPLDWEISRIENEVTKLERDIKKNFDALAQEMVATENLKKNVETARTNLTTNEVKLKDMRVALDSKTQKISFDNRNYTKPELEGKFTREWNKFKVAQKEIDVREKQLSQKQEHIDALKAKIESIKNVREELRTEIADMKTELERVRTTQNKTKIQFDDSRLSRIQGDLADVKGRLDVMKKRAELEANFNGTTPAETTETNNLEVQKAKEAFDNQFGDKVNAEPK